MADPTLAAAPPPPPPSLTFAAHRDRGYSDGDNDGLLAAPPTDDDEWTVAPRDGLASAVGVRAGPKHDFELVPPPPQPAAASSPGAGGSVGSPPGSSSSSDRDGGDGGDGGDGSDGTDSSDDVAHRSGAAEARAGKLTAAEALVAAVASAAVEASASVDMDQVLTAAAAYGRGPRGNQAAPGGRTVEATEAATRHVDADKQRGHKQARAPAKAGVHAAGAAAAAPAPAPALRQLALAQLLHHRSGKALPHNHSWGERSAAAGAGSGGGRGGDARHTPADSPRPQMSNRRHSAAAGAAGAAGSGAGGGGGGRRHVPVASPRPKTRRQSAPAGAAAAAATAEGYSSDEPAAEGHGGSGGRAHRSSRRPSPRNQRNRQLSPVSAPASAPAALHQQQKQHRRQQEEERRRRWSATRPFRGALHKKRRRGNMGWCLRGFCIDAKSNLCQVDGDPGDGEVDGRGPVPIHRRRFVARLSAEAELRRVGGGDPRAFRLVVEKAGYDRCFRARTVDEALAWRRALRGHGCRDCCDKPGTPPAAAAAAGSP